MSSRGLHFGGLRLGGSDLVTLDEPVGTVILNNTQGFTFVGPGVIASVDPLRAGFARVEVFAGAGGTLQTAYDGFEVITTDAQGAIDFIRGLLTPDGEPLLTLVDANANPGRTVSMVSLDDSNVVGAGEPGTVRITRTTAGIAVTLRSLGAGVEMQEVAAVPGGAPAAGFGKWWVRSDIPNVPIFTDDVGIDHVLAFTGATSLQTAYDAGETIVLDAQGAVDITRGALIPDGEPAVLLTDANANPGRTAAVLDIQDTNVVGADVGTVRIARTAAGDALVLSNGVSNYLRVRNNANGVAFINQRTAAAGAVAYHILATANWTRTGFVIFIEDNGASPGAGSTLLGIGGDGSIQTLVGSAADPIITAITDLNTGLFFTGADGIGFSAGGTEIIQISQIGGGAIFRNAIAAGATPAFIFRAVSDFAVGQKVFSIQDFNGVEIFAVDGIGLIDPIVGVQANEQAAVPGGAPPAGVGTFWIRNDAPNVPMFTDDGGNDRQLAVVGGTTSYIAAWYEDAPQLGVTDNLLEFGFIGSLRQRFIPVRAGSITGISYAGSVAVVQGVTLTINARKNGTIVFTMDIVAADGTKKTTTQASGTDTYAAGDEITVSYSTTGTVGAAGPTSIHVLIEVTQ